MARAAGDPICKASGTHHLMVRGSAGALPPACLCHFPHLSLGACAMSVHLLLPTHPGFNSSIFVYGQTGAGKTHTITGDVSRAEDGVLAEQVGQVPTHLPGSSVAQEPLLLCMLLLCCCLGVLLRSHVRVRLPACSAASPCASSASCLTASQRRSGTACGTPSSAGAQGGGAANGACPAGFPRIEGGLRLGICPPVRPDRA